MRILTLAFIGFLLIAPLAGAVTIEAPLADPAQEKIAQSSFHDLRCVVCEGQALSESDAPLAHQMREEIRDMARFGKTEPEILDYFRARYGERILLTAPIEKNTYALWLAPFLLLIGGAILVWRFTR